MPLFLVSKSSGVSPAHDLTGVDSETAPKLTARPRVIIPCKPSERS